MIFAPSAGCRRMIPHSSSVSLPGLVRTSFGIRTFPRSCRSRETPKPRTSLGPSPMNSASAIASTLTLSECVVVYWSNCFSCSNGMTMSRSPVIPTNSERTTLSASISGSSPLICTSSCSQRILSGSSPSEYWIVAVGRLSAGLRPAYRPLLPAAPPLLFDREPLNPGVGETQPPVPLPQLPQCDLTIDDVEPEERELRGRVLLLQLAQPLVRCVDHADARGMPVSVERHGGERLREGVEEPGRLGAHDAPPRRATASLSSASELRAARSSTCWAAGSSRQCAASPASAASSSGDFEASARRRRKRFLPVARATRNENVSGERHHHSA